MVWAWSELSLDIEACDKIALLYMDFSGIESSAKEFYNNI